MNVDVHILAFNEAEIIGYAIRHWRLFARRIVVHDGGSTDGTQAIAKMYGAECSTWNTEGKMNDLCNMECKNTCWQGTDADWVVCADADELLYFPQGAEATLATYSRIGAAMIKPHGFDMVSDAFPTTEKQIYDEVKQGAPADFWYGKPILFSPQKLKESGFGIGAHEAHPVLKNGRTLKVGRDWPKANPPTWLLHFHHGIGPIERVAARLDAQQRRYAQPNIAHGWGNHAPGMVHAIEKREGFKAAGIRKIIP